MQLEPPEQGGEEVPPCLSERVVALHPLELHEHELAVLVHRLRDDREILDQRGADPEVDAHRPERRLIAEAEAGRDGRAITGREVHAPAVDQAGVHEDRAGDRVLTAVATVLTHRLRESDILARFGGDEFAVLMPVGGVQEATGLAELLEAAIRADVPTPAAPQTASVGIALFSDLSTADEMLSRADDAMYAEKRAGGPAVRHLRAID